MAILTNNKFLIFVLVVIFLTVIIVSIDYNKGRAYGYQALRTLHKTYMAHVTKDFQELRLDNFIIKYKDIPKETALMVAENGQEVFEPVSKMLGFTPTGDIPVIVYPTKEELNQSFGWEGDKSAMGVYWMGTIRILAPEAWANTQDPQEKAEIFRAIGPMAHEFAHLVVDYKTSGNYTRWFTEGIAQYAEKELTGFVLDEPTKEAKANIYPFDVLDRDFDYQPDQELAYWQSLIAVEYLVDIYGSQVITQILDQLAQGETMDTSFKKIIGQDLSRFEKTIRGYISDLLREAA